MVRQHQSTRFPLTGSHAQIDCEGCHKPTAQGQLQFVGTKAECQNCHMDAYKSATNPDHQAGGLPAGLLGCHSTLTWGTKSFDHDKTALPADRRARATACGAVTATACTRARARTATRATRPTTTAPRRRGTGGGLPDHLRRSTCHTTVAWNTATFDHNKTAIPAHRRAQRGAVQTAVTVTASTRARRRTAIPATRPITPTRPKSRVVGLRTTVARATTTVSGRARCSITARRSSRSPERTPRCNARSATATVFTPARATLTATRATRPITWQRDTEPRVVGLPTACDTCHYHDHLDERDVQSQHARHSRSPERTPRCVHAVPRRWCFRRQGHAAATRATGPITPTRHRTTRRRASRTTCHTAIPRPPGRARCSITARRSSR